MLLCNYAKGVPRMRAKWLRVVEFNLADCGRLSGGRVFFKLFCPSNTVYRLPAKLGRLCGAQQGGADYGAAPANLMPNTA